MCYGCDLKLLGGEIGCGIYLDVRAEYARLAGQFERLESEMLYLEDRIIDPDQRKHWHSVRAQVIRARKLTNTAFNDRLGEKK